MKKLIVLLMFMSSICFAGNSIFNNSGNVGIGITNPCANLSVIGNVTIGTGTSAGVPLTVEGVNFGTTTLAAGWVSSAFGGKNGGEATHTLIATEMPAHVHSIKETICSNFSKIYLRKKSQLYLQAYSLKNGSK